MYALLGVKKRPTPCVHTYLYVLIRLDETNTLDPKSLPYFFFRKEVTIEKLFVENWHFHLF